MQRFVWFALLTISLVVTIPAQGQARGGGGGGSGFGGGPGFGNGSFGGHRGFGRPGRGYGGYGAFLVPWYYPDYGLDWGWDLGPSDYYPQPPAEPAPPAVIVVQSRDDNRLSAPAPQSPKLIELPETKESGTTAQAEPPTVFVFTNGERLEARRYTLTPDSLHVEINRQQRTIPLGRLNLDATIAANRERGIDLKVPTDKSQIFLGF
jgi:hypothetical protein